MPSDNTENVRERFSLSGEAEMWDGMYREASNTFQYHMLLRRNNALSYIAEHHPTSVSLLDLGCGAGVLTEELLKKGYRTHAVDISMDMLRLAEMRCSAFPEGEYLLAQGECFHLPFRDAQFDLVVCLGMFGYFKESDLALQEINRVLRPGGTLILSVRNKYHEVLTDPLLSVKKVIAKISQGFSRGKPRGKPVAGSPSLKAPEDRPTGAHANASAISGSNFMIRMFEKPGYLIAGVTRNGYDLTQMDGIGYGSLRLFGKPVIPEKVSISLSRFFERIFRKTRLHYLTRWIADVTTYVFIKS
ncbi:class I SAM-dependent methyltransferase [Haliea sp. E17]|uniref:class I SAM-dependent methyltransferase n=1 Tax=Haliea sp. E17 TaxID=3401576 RepID=UPI003AAD2B9F